MKEEYKAKRNLSCKKSISFKKSSSPPKLCSCNGNVSWSGMSVCVSAHINLKSISTILDTAADFL